MARRSSHRSPPRSGVLRVGRFFASAALGVAACALVGCTCGSNAEEAADPEARDPATGLTRAEAELVVAEVGERRITLGEYAATVRNLGRFEKLRYQTPERRRELLEHMIDLELLAGEARRRGLDRTPEVELGTQQALRDELLEELRRTLPPPEKLSEKDVRDYYEAHRSEFEEPERRRALVIAVPNEALARKIRAELEDAPATRWGELAAKYSLERRGLGDKDPLEFAGDLGFVSAPGEKRGENLSVPEEVRAALFRLEKLGDVSKEPIAVGTRYYLVRLGAQSAARARTLAEADRTIRVELQRQMFREKERALEEELRKKYPVEVDEEKLAAWKKAYEASRAERKKP